MQWKCLLAAGAALAFAGLAACAAPTPTPAPKPTPTPVPVGAMPTPSALLKAKQEAEAEGYIFETSHDEIVARAKQEGKLRTLSTLVAPNYPHLIEAFKKKYPFIDIYVEEVTGAQAGQRLLLELKAGLVKEWDVIHPETDFYNDFSAYFKKFDILGMAQQKVLAIPTQMIDPNNRNIVAFGSSVTVIAYNKRLIDPAKVPNTWEDLLKPEFKGRKFLTRVRAEKMACLVPAMGLDWVLDYARKFAAQEPIWSEGFTRELTAMAAGEYAMYAFTNYHSTVRVMQNDPTHSLDYKIIEPVPVALEVTDGVISSAPHPYAGLLWLELLASPEAQKIIDQYEPLKASVFVPGAKQAEVVSGKKLSVVGWDHFQMMQGWQEKIFEAWGFPKASTK